MTDYAIVKLSNGENIICRVVQKTDSDITVQSPLKMESVNKITQAGISEHLSLVRWLQPFSDEKNFTIEKNSVVFSTPASIGLSKYYEYVLRELNKLPIQNPKEEELKKIEKEQEEEIDLSKVTIH